MPNIKRMQYDDACSKSKTLSIVECVISLLNATTPKLSSTNSRAAICSISSSDFLPPSKPDHYNDPRQWLIYRSFPKSIISSPSTFLQIGNIPPPTIFFLIFSMSNSVSSINIIFSLR